MFNTLRKKKSHKRDFVDIRNNDAPSPISFAKGDIDLDLQQHIGW